MSAEKDTQSLAKGHAGYSNNEQGFPSRGGRWQAEKELQPEASRAAE